MDRVTMVEIDGAIFLRVKGVRRLYVVRDGEKLAFCGEDWCLLVKGSRRKLWASIRVFRLFHGVRAYSAGVNTRTWKPSGSEGAKDLAKTYPGVLEWAAKATMQFLHGKVMPKEPPTTFMPEPVMVAHEPREATREEERMIADMVRHRQNGRPLSQHRVTRPTMRYIGDEVENAFGVPEETVFIATKRLIGMGVLEDFMVDSRSKMRGLRVVESAYAERFAALIEKEGAAKETVDAQ